MLVKTVFLICLKILMISSVMAAEAKRPDVFVVVGDAKLRAKERSSPPYYWFSPGRIANLAALLYGKTPLECGVVSDLDWRRKPVKGESLADHYHRAGYYTVFIGEWGMGEAKPYDPESRGFDAIWSPEVGDKKTLEEAVFEESRGKKEFLESLAQSKPWFFVLRQGRRGMDGSKFLDSVTREYGPRTGWLVNMTAAGARFSPLNGYAGKLPQENPRTISELNSALLALIGGKPTERSPYIFYHQGGWPLTDAPEKHRHRGSTVLGEKFALVDGLELYPLAAPLSISQGDPLDLGDYAKPHQALLSAHAEWWQRARISINDPRSFDVGQKDDEALYLTALDWRPTLILHKDGSTLASQPMVYQERLLATLRGLHDNEDYKQSFPAYSGSWSVHIRRPGRYQITARLLPDSAMKPEDADLAKLEGGRAHIRLGLNEVQLQVLKGATSVSVLVDADQGVADLECWFTGQLSLERELGAFFVEIQRVGDKKFKLKAPSGALQLWRSPFNHIADAFNMAPAIFNVESSLN